MKLRICKKYSYSGYRFFVQVKKYFFFWGVFRNTDLATNWGTTFAQDWNYKYFETLAEAEKAVLEYYSCTKSVMEVGKVINLKKFI